jgi:hypothetical protein
MTTVESTTEEPLQFERDLSVSTLSANFLVHPNQTSDALMGPRRQAALIAKPPPISEKLVEHSLLRLAEAFSEGSMSPVESESELITP